MKFSIGICLAAAVYHTVASRLPTPAPGKPGISIPSSASENAPLEKRFRIVSVDLPTGGTVKGRSFLNIDSFNAIPYADPPVGQLRLRPPRRLSSGSGLGTIDGTGIAPACPQMVVSSEAKDLIGKALGTIADLPLLKPITGQEDCLTVNVQRPVGAKPGDKLPVLYWIFGGGFQIGSTNTYDATSLLLHGVGQGQPFIFVAVNYRLGGFGFMPGREVLKNGSANLGLLDQRMGLEWVADNIEAFGGDASKVTIWGESAGAISVFNQMLLYGGNATYKGKPLFRGAIMNSGTATPSDPVDCAKGQAVYNTVVKSAGCSGSQNTLQCLRDLDYKTFHHATNSVPSIMSYNSVALAYLPRPDGKVLPDSPERLVEQGKYHAVPAIVGDQEDEGTLFSILQVNLTTAEDMADYLSDVFFHHAPKEKLKQFVGFYEPGLVRGSPFRTGIFNELYPGFKRTAAILGDLTFTLTRRIVLKLARKANPDVPMWSYLASYNYGTPVLGTFHASDILQIFMGILPNHAMRSCRTYYFNFLYSGDPNRGVERYDKWPQWGVNQELMWFKSPVANGILADDFRSDAENWMFENKDMLRI
ncbi:cholinesterase [Purpureocillium lavendulum]|uniref:Carboxylic ester hydrolase n=1 Tax=Purpureocillium lavendulum TaxID=1247861 RepID=A0AB34G0F9_9HYPO|nr:cholinesterase [Purpureocillium lavendulum]